MQLVDGYIYYKFINIIDFNLHNWSVISALILITEVSWESLSGHMERKY